MNVEFNWRHMPAVLGAMAFGAVVARDQLALAPSLVVVPGLMGLAVGVIGRALGAGVSTLFFGLFAAMLCWLDGGFLYYLPAVLLSEVAGAVLGRGLVARPREQAA